MNWTLRSLSGLAARPFSAHAGSLAACAALLLGALPGHGQNAAGTVAAEAALPVPVPAPAEETRAALPARLETQAVPNLLETPQPPATPETAPEPVRALPKLEPVPWNWQPLSQPVSLHLRAELPELGGLPLLHLAVLHDEPEWIAELISRGADPNEPTPGGDTPLCAAIRQGSAACVKELLLGGADPSLTNFENQPPLALASLRRGPEILDALITAGADPNTRFAHPVARSVLDRVTIKDLKNTLESDRGATVLIACTARGDVEGTTVLMRAGARTNLCTTRHHRYPINFAATQGYLFLMRILLGRQPESEPEILVTINLTTQRAWVMKEGQIVDSCSVSTGRAGYATPAGRYVITDKHRSWTSTLYHVAMPFFMRLNCSAIGLHSGYVTGRPASHGCIRLPYEKARSFFEICRVGDEVQIVY